MKRISHPKFETASPSRLLTLLVTLSLAAGVTAQSEGLYANGSLPTAAIGEFLLGDVSGDGLTDALEIGDGFAATAVRLGRPDGTFGPVASYPSGAYHQLIADFTGDDITDVLTFNPNADQLAVLPGTGDGAFGPVITTKLSQLGLFITMVAGDVDEDGDLDLALVDMDDTVCNCVRVYEATGVGTFMQPPTNVTLGQVITSLQLADITGDGHLDVVALFWNGGADKIAVVPGDGAGGFGATLTTALPFFEDVLFPADFDGDGLLDLVVTGWSTLHASLLGVFRGTGSTFLWTQTVSLIASPPQTLVPLSVPWVGDVDGAGSPDILVGVTHAKPNDGGLWFLAGLGGFSFAPPTVTDTDSDAGYSNFFFADVNADGRIDAEADDLHALMLNYGRGDGTFETPGRVEVGVPTEDIAAGDLDVDGDADLVVTTQVPLPRVITLLGAGDGAFASQNSAPAQSPDELLVADIDGDGWPDALTWSSKAGSALQLLAGNGQGAFGTPVLLQTGAIRDAAVADLNLDGQLDIVASRPDLQGGLVQLSTGGSFGSPVPVPLGLNPGGLAVADLTGDGSCDLAVTETADASVSVFAGFGGAAFGAPQPLAVSAGPSAVTAGDVDGDGDLDLAVTCYDIKQQPWGWIIENAAVVVRQESPGTFAQPETYQLGLSTPADEIVVADVDRDGHPDLMMAPAEGSELQADTLLLLHAGAGGWPEQLEFRTGAAPSGVAIADLDADGFPDAAVSQAGENDVRIYLNRSPTWATLGHALTSGAGVPLLIGAGDPIPDQLVTLTCSLAPAPSQGLLFVGLAAPFSPFQGGVLVPSPDVVVPVRANFTLSQRWPKGIPTGTPVYLQAWFQSLATGEVSATNALVTIAQ